MTDAVYPRAGVFFAALVLQTNGMHWVLGETRAHQARAVVGSPVLFRVHLSAPY